MIFRAAALFICLLLASAAAAETVYKYRRADGQTTYSNRVLPGLELIETFEYRFTAAAAVDPNAAKSGNEADARMKQHLSALDKAWSEVQNATKALAAAEARLTAGAGPLAGEEVSLGGPEALSPSDIGGAQAPVPPAVGGAQPPAAPKPGETLAQAAAASRAVGGPMGTRRGGGRNAEYGERIAGLESDVQKARARLDAALNAYNQLR
jgi:hypothetical protein